VQIFGASFSTVHVNHAINRCWRRALVIIEGEIPSPAAGMAVIEAKNTIPKDAQASFVRHFVETTFLQRLINHHQQQLRDDIETETDQSLRVASAMLELNIRGDDKLT